MPILSRGMRQHNAAMRWFISIILSVSLTAGCSSKRTPDDVKARAVRAADVALPEGYRIDAVATGLNFPTAVAVDDEGVPYVVEAGYSYGEVFTTPRLLRINTDGSTAEIASGDNGPWNGVAYHGGSFYVSEGGVEKGGAIIRIDRDGKITPIIENLPSLGDHHTNGPAIGPDGMLYFGVGSATNSGVVGTDNAEFGWLERHPGFCDVPPVDITLTGENFTTSDPRTKDKDDKATTGAYVPFGTRTSEGQIIKGQMPCNGAVLKVPLDGGTPELVAWGLRNPYGLTFASDGKLFVTENSFDERGSRPVYGTGDLVWEIKEGTWYGWPDFFAGEALASKRYASRKHDAPKFLLAEHPNDPPAPLAKLGVHSSSNGLDVSRNGSFGHPGNLFIAQFGDMSPNTGEVYGRVGFRVVRVDPETGFIHTFAANRGEENGPASALKRRGFERPNDVQFDSGGNVLYVVDFGILDISKEGKVLPRKNTGVLWRITREGKR